MGKERSRKMGYSRMLETVEEKAESMPEKSYRLRYGNVVLPPLKELACNGRERSCLFLPTQRPRRKTVETGEKKTTSFPLYLSQFAAMLGNERMSGKS